MYKKTNVMSIFSSFSDEKKALLVQTERNRERSEELTGGGFL